MPEPTKRTIYDVAREADVAISTVSRVLNGSGSVSAKTRERVEGAIERLGFRPKRAARTLARQQAHAIAVAVPSFTSLFYVELLKGVKDELRERDTDLLLCNLGSAAPRQTLHRFLGRGAVDALLLASLPVDEDLERELLKLQAPVVLVGARSARFDCFFWDDEGGAERAVAHLVERGHTRIGMIAAHTRGGSTDARRRGYGRALAAAGIPADPALVVTGDTAKHAGYSEEAGAEAMQKLLALDEAPTAVFAASDVQAFGAWAALRDAGLRVPEDVALAGYDGLKLSRYLGLTTVDQRMLGVGRRAARRLAERLAGEAPSEPIAEQVPPELVVRRSSRGT